MATKNKLLLQNRLKTRRHFIFFIWTASFIYYISITDFNPHHVPCGAYGASINSQDSKSFESTVDASNSIPYIPVPTSESVVNPLNNSETYSIYNSDNSKATTKKTEKRKYAEWEVPGETCTPPGIDDFPEDLFTPAQRQQGWLIVHFIVSIYLFYALAIICDDFFVPSLECICEELKMPSDVAGATLMAIATSSPELFTNIFGTFLTKGDVGVGTIVGSAVFNILAVSAVCGIWSGMIIHLEWYSVTRDCIFYSLSVMLLIGVLRDEKIFWYEAMVLVSVYVLYIIGMYNNSRLKRSAEKLVYKLQNKVIKSVTDETTYDPVKQKEGIEVINRNGNGVYGTTVAETEDEKIDEAVEEYNDALELQEQKVVEEALKHAEDEAEEEENEYALFRLPWGYGARVWIEWFIGWPIRAIYTLTVPDCREASWRRWYPITFVMCIMWIGVLAYVVNWMMTIIGHTLKIPDSIMGLSFIAAGTSIPEVVSSLIVSRQGLGTMALSNSIGSNTFDILMCLGLPWLIRSSLIANEPEQNFIKINSIGLEYSAIMLITSLGVLYAILACNRYVLDKKVGIIALVLYAGFLIMASLFELNVFFTVNLPTCIHHED